MCAPSIRNMHHSQRVKEYMARLRERQITERLLRAEIRRLGDELYQLTTDDADWERFWGPIAEDAPLSEIHDALALEIERRSRPPVDNDAYQAWLAAMADVDRLADENRPETAAAIKIEEAAHQVYLQSIERRGATIEITPK